MPARLRYLAAFALAALIPAAAAAQEILRVPYDPLAAELSERIDFETYPRRMSPGVQLDGQESFPGAAIAERFAGQETRTTGPFDALAGQPSGPLRLTAGAVGQNLAVNYVYLFSNQLTGLGPLGWPERDAEGEGAVAILFELDQAALGLRVTSEPRPRDPEATPGRMQIGFFRRDGSLIDRLDIVLDWGIQGYGFRRAGALRDIAGIAITNRDPAGIGIDDIIFDYGQVTGWLAPMAPPKG
jgi:hypothetical protein